MSQDPGADRDRALDLVPGGTARASAGVARRPALVRRQGPRHHGGRGAPTSCGSRRRCGRSPLVVVDVVYEPDTARPAGSAARCCSGCRLKPSGAIADASPGDGSYVADQASERRRGGARCWPACSAAPAATGGGGGVLTYADTTPAARQVLAAAVPPAIRAGRRRAEQHLRDASARPTSSSCSAASKPGSIRNSKWDVSSRRRDFPRCRGSRDRSSTGPPTDRSRRLARSRAGWPTRATAGATCWRGSTPAAATSTSAPTSTPSSCRSARRRPTSTPRWPPTPPSTRLRPIPVTAADAALWQHDLEAQAERTFDAARAAPVDADAGAGRRRAGRAGGARRRGAAARRRSTTTAAFDRIRIHGDFHLGQTLKTPGGFVIIDFEGEPAQAARRAAAEAVRAARRGRDAALARLRRGGVEPGRRTRGHASGPAGGDAAGVPRGLSRPGRRSALASCPHVAEDRDAWTSLFELEKALYEVEYELNNRPTWVLIPLDALSRLLDAAR